jgi:hypothetical protein
MNSIFCNFYLNTENKIYMQRNKMYGEKNNDISSLDKTSLHFLEHTNGTHLYILRNIPAQASKYK